MSGDLRKLSVCVLDMQKWVAFVFTVEPKQLIIGKFFGAMRICYFLHV